MLAGLLPTPSRRWRTTTTTVVRCSTLLVIILTVSALLHFVKVYTCSNANTEKIIAGVCKDVSSRVGGPLCPVLCGGLLGLQECQTDHFQKHLVFSAKWSNSSGNDEVVFKVYDEARRDMDVASACPSRANLTSRMSKELKSDLGVRASPADAVEILFGKGAGETVAKDKGVGCGVKGSMLAVMWAREFMYFRALEGMNVFPKVVGHCGNMYASAKLAPLPYPTWSTPDTLGTWIGHLELALKILQLEARMEAGMGKELRPLVLCDMKREHLAVDPVTGDVKILDGDNAYLQPKGDKHMSKNGKRVCSHDGDCHVLDCKGRCNTDKGRCLPNIVNSNLQMICERIYLGRFREVYKPSQRGLLSSKHASSALASLLEECAFPTGGSRREANALQRESLINEMNKQLDMAKRRRDS